METVPEKINFADEEKNTLQYWKKIDAFKTSLKQSQNRPKYNFYDGPPFATGLPHYGHILTGATKDIVTRYYHQMGYHVPRVFGWDCHGLPVEYEIDKKLGIKSPADVKQMGITRYNAECKSIVMRYSSQWEDVVTRLGRWIDFKNDYKTMYPWFMESVWWAFRELYYGGHVYRGSKVMPYSTGCYTPLSNFEATQNYKEVSDPAVIVTFPLDEDNSVQLLAWTTTPWTLPSNLALCVNADMTYVKLREVATGNVYIMMLALVSAMYKDASAYEVLEEFQGKALEGKTYKPLFPYFEEMKKRGAFKVLCDSYVKDDSGTGVVHQAPYFGADDFRVCLANGVIRKDDKEICPINETGCFTNEVPDYEGQYVKDADKEICKRLKAEGRMVSHKTVNHSYPFCWRSDTPLIYRSVGCWFIHVERIREKLLANNDKTYWVPQHVKDKRFGNWLRDARDWCVSRNRYWGTPIPIWASDDFEEVVCVGSIAELEELSGQKLGKNGEVDLHREFVDHIVIPSKYRPDKPLRRITETFDCWFESGAMPYAQKHYPFENKKSFEKNFPAQFIAEGIDQTRGWFYTLSVLSSLLFDSHPFQNLIVTGLVLAGDGQKMSKRKKNYPDPLGVMDKYGSDSLRLYLINSPVVRAENLRFKEDGVRDILKDVLLPMFNAYRFLVQNVLRHEKENGVKMEFSDDVEVQTDNMMDQWMLSMTQSLILFVRKEMEAYHLYTVVPRLLKFVEILCNWYVRVNRRRLKGEGGAADCEMALSTLFHVVFTMVKVMSPFTPFITEYMYQNLRKSVPTHANDPDKASCHFLMIPLPKMEMINEDIERAVSRMQQVIELGRVIRDRKALPVKYPMPKIVVIHKDPQYFEDLKKLEQYVKEELNVRVVEYSSDKETYNVTVRAEPDHMILGKRLKGDFKKVTAGIRKMTSAQCEEFAESGKCQVEGHELVTGELRLIFGFEGTGANVQYAAHSDNDVLVLLDVQPDQSMQDEGVAREVINRIQKLRKKGNLVPTDTVIAYYHMVNDTGLSNILKQFGDFIRNATKSPMCSCKWTPSKVVVEETVKDLKGCDSVHFTLAYGSESDMPSRVNVPVEPMRCLNLYKKSESGDAVRAIVLTENPKNETKHGVKNLEQFARSVLDCEDKTQKFENCGEAFVLGDGVTSAAKSNQMLPPTSYVNVLSMNDSNYGTLLLENPLGQNALTMDKLEHQMKNLFNRVGEACTTKVYKNVELTQEVSNMEDLQQANVVYCCFSSN